MAKKTSKSCSLRWFRERARYSLRKRKRLPTSKRPGISLIPFDADKIGTRRLEAATQSSDCSAETSEVSTEAAESG